MREEAKAANDRPRNIISKGRAAIGPNARASALLGREFYHVMARICL